MLASGWWIKTTKLQYTQFGRLVPARKSRYIQQNRISTPCDISRMNDERHYKKRRTEKEGPRNSQTLMTRYQNPVLVASNQFITQTQIRDDHHVVPLGPIPYFFFKYFTIQTVHSVAQHQVHRPLSTTLSCLEQHALAPEDHMRPRARVDSAALC